jgi:predicted helicase
VGDGGGGGSGFRIPDGAAPTDPFVTILDPATGTGTFLVEVIDLIHHRMIDKWRAAGHKRDTIDVLWNEYVPKHLLPRLYGYELMMAPYAIAHMKLGLKLAETGYKFLSKERARVYLTNALEPPQRYTGDVFSVPALEHESRAVNAVKKDKRFTVVIGNPPYSGHSANKGEWIERLMRSPLSKGAPGFFEIDGVGLAERNPKWLNDDYVKFIRLAQSLTSASSVGIVGLITNHGYLDNPTFRGMRRSLMRSFSTIRIVDLNGNVKKGGGDLSDQNVFDIQQGVAVGLLGTSGRSIASAELFFGEMKGSR